MKPSSMEFNQLLSKVTSQSLDEAAVRSLQVVATSMELSQQFVEALLATQSLSGGGTESAVPRTLIILERLAEQSKLASCILMAHLWPVASDLYMHDVCDSIDLWASNNKSPELNQRLQLLACSQSDDDVKKHFEQLAQE